MSERHIAFTVLLDEAISTDQSKAIAAAINMLNGVRLVTPVVQDVHQLFVHERIRHEIGQQLWKILYPDTTANPFDKK